MALFRCCWVWVLFSKQVIVELVYTLVGVVLLLSLCMICKVPGPVRCSIHRHGGSKQRRNYQPTQNTITGLETGIVEHLMLVSNRLQTFGTWGIMGRSK